MGQLSGALEAVTTRAAECELEAEGLRERVAGLTDELVSADIETGPAEEAWVGGAGGAGGGSIWPT